MAVERKFEVGLAALLAIAHLCAHWGQETKVILGPDLHQRRDKLVHHLLGVERGWGDTQFLLPARDSGIVDSLDVNAVLG